MKRTIISLNGAEWKHKLLLRIIKSKEFPMRLRLFNYLKRAFGLDLLYFKTPSGLKLVLDFNDWVQSQIYYHGNYEPHSVSLFKTLANNAEVILDIGAHVGQYALECAQDDTAKAKRIFAIEVNPKTFTYLLNNVQINDFTQVEVILGAVYNKREILNINIPAYWNMGNTQISDLSGVDSFSSASFTISDLVDKYQLTSIDLVKLDVEGQELNIINNFFSERIYPKHILFEFLPGHFTNATAVVDLLRDNNYKIIDVAGRTFSDNEEVLEQNLLATRW